MKKPKEILEDYFGSDYYQLHGNESYIIKAMNEYAIKACTLQREACALWIEDSRVKDCPLVIEIENP